MSPVQDKLRLVCEPGTKIVIVKADFGRDKYSMACDDKYYQGYCTSRDDSVKDILAKQCGNLESCDVKVSTDTFPDPCPNVIKLLRVWYQCIGEGNLKKKKFFFNIYKKPFI